jgi:thiol-disulfide isomerase/thioredoxin
MRGLLFCIFWVVGLLTAESAAAQGAATLTGRVSKPTADSIHLRWHAQPLEHKEQTASARLSPKGDFQLQLQLAAPVLAELSYGDAETSIFLEPGDALQLKFKGEELNTSLKFQSADGAAHKAAANANNYLTESENKFANNEGFQVLPENIELYEVPFISFLDYRRKQQLKEYKSAGGPGAFTPAFAAFAEAEINYLYANDRLTYPDLREQVVGTESRLQLTPGFYDFTRDAAIVPGPENAPTSPEAQEFMLNYVHYQVRAEGKPLTDPGYYPACYQLAARTFKGAMRPIILGRVLLETFRFGHYDHATAMLADYTASAQAPPAWLALLHRDLEAHKEMAIGTPAPPLPLRTMEGDSVRLAVYRGRLVYVMFWDSRLPLSQRELPYLKEVVKQFAGKPIVFVSAAFDEGANKKLPPGTATAPSVEPAVVPARARPKVRQAYDIETLPSFVLIAEDGTVLDPNPKRLSSRALLDDLQAAFGKAAAYRAVRLPKP